MYHLNKLFYIVILPSVSLNLGDRIVAEETNGNVIVYIYDENWQPLGMQYHGASYEKSTWDVYWFEKNLFGDIISVRSNTGTLLVQYKYNAYGECTVTYSNNGGSTTATLNPFRYRGYYFDKDLNLYYVNSRYYDAKLCRWISPDAVEIIASTPMSLSDNNLYAYCDNNPVNRVDYGGNVWLPMLIGAGVGALGGVVGQVFADGISSLLNGELSISNWETYTGAAIGGAAGGAVLGGTGNVSASNFVSGFVSTGAGMSLEKVFGNSEKTWGEIGKNALADGIASFFLGKLPGVEGITSETNNMDAVFRSGLTKLRNATAGRMSLKVASKGFVANIFSDAASNTYQGIKQSSIGQAIEVVWRWLW